MTDWSKHEIRSLEDAEAYFKHMGCSGYIMWREYPDRSEEYEKLGISSETEKQWAIEERDRLLTEIAGPTPSEELWVLHGRIAHLPAPGGTKAFYKATLAILGHLDTFDKVLVAENIIGRADVFFMGGMVYLARMQCKRRIAKHLAVIALDLAKQAYEKDPESERIQSLLKKCKRIRMVSRFF